MPYLQLWSENGYKLAIQGYEPNRQKPYASVGQKIGGDAKPQKNPCTKCGLNGLCDSDECGKKTYHLFSKDKPKK